MWHNTGMFAYHLIKQKLTPFETSATNPDELTRQLPRGLYSTFVTNHGGTRVLGLTAHLDRLFVPAEERNLRPSASRADLWAALSSLASSNAPAESRFRILLSDSDGTVYVILQPFTPLAKEIYEHGVKAITAELTRHDPRLKDTGFITESQSVRAKAGDEIFEVLLTKRGKIYEGMTSNFYVVPQNLFCEGQNESCDTLVTARTGILLGVTRRAVLRLARGQGMEVDYRPPRVEENFVEAFLTSSSRGVVPIIQIDGRLVGEGRPGPWTKRLALAYQAYVEERSETLVE